MDTIIEFLGKLLQVVWLLSACSILLLPLAWVISLAIEDIN